jgi:hypothetical protein
MDDAGTGADVAGIRAFRSDVFPPTLGAYLHRAAQRLATSHHTTLGWAPLLRPVLMRMAAFQEHDGRRFARTEVAPRTQRGERSRRPAYAYPLGDRLTATAGRSLPIEDGSWLRDVAGAGAERLRVRTGGDADTLARHYDADAVTIGGEVSFRDGRFSLDDPAGRALLAHEASHVAAHQDDAVAEPSRTPATSPAQRPGAVGSPGWPQIPSGDPATWPGRHDDTAALALERAVLANQESAGTGSDGARRALVGDHRWVMSAAAGPERRPPVEGPATMPSGPGVGVDRAAAGPATPQSVSRAPAGRDLRLPAAPALDLAALRRDLLADLMRQLHTEFERGG